MSKELSTTLSKGIVSGFRKEDGLRYIQSDVNILPGSSGGPLLDEYGNVAGIAVSFLPVGETPAGLNFFIPVEEALAVLEIEFVENAE